MSSARAKELIDLGDRLFSAKAPFDTLCQEIAEREKNVYAVKETRSAQFQAGLEQCRAGTAERIGQFEADDNVIVLYVLR